MPLEVTPSGESSEDVHDDPTWEDESCGSWLCFGRVDSLVTTCAESPTPITVEDTLQLPPDQRAAAQYSSLWPAYAARLKDPANAKKNMLLPLLISSVRPQLYLGIFCELTFRISSLVLAWLIGEVRTCMCVCSWPSTTVCPQLAGFNYNTVCPQLTAFNYSGTSLSEDHRICRHCKPFSPGPQLRPSGG